MTHRLPMYLARLMGLSLLISICFTIIPSHAMAACAPPSDKGQATLTVSVTEAKTYRLWLRQYVPAAAVDAVYVQIDDTVCAIMGNSNTLRDDSFAWVGYANGDAASMVQLDLPAGQHKLLVAGIEPKAGADRLLFAADSSCIPIGMGENCESTAVGIAPPNKSEQAITPPATHAHHATSFYEFLQRMWWLLALALFLLLAGIVSGCIVMHKYYPGLLRRWMRMPTHPQYGQAEVVQPYTAMHPAPDSPKAWHLHLPAGYHLERPITPILLLAGALICIVVLALLGARAMGQGVGIEIEAAQLSSGASVIERTGASGGRYVQFDSQTPAQSTGGGNTPSPSGTGTGGGSTSGGGSTGGSPSGGTSGGGQSGGGASPVSGWPTDNNTGYPHGLPGDSRTPVTLTPYGGPCTITVANTVINGKDITCRIIIRAANVVIKNSRIRVSNENAIYVNDVYHLTVMDTELDGQRQDNSAGGISLIGDGSYTLIRVNAHSSGDIARINWGGVAIVDSWLHDTYCLQASCHNDVTQSTDGDCTIGVDSINGVIAGTSDTSTGSYCIKLVHNTFDNPNTQTSNVLLKADQGSIHNVLVENNLFSGGGYTFYWYDSGFQISNGIVRNNRFKRSPTGGYWPNGGYYGPVASNVSDSTRWPTWTNNVWDDNGATISF